MPLEPAFKKALENSLREARDLGHNYLGNEHIVLALLQGKGIVAEVLAERRCHVRGDSQTGRERSRQVSAGRNSCVSGPMLERVEDRADADRAAEQPAGAEHEQFDDGADHPQGSARAAAESGDHAVARARSEPGADVGGERHRVQHDAEDEQHDPRQKCLAAAGRIASVTSTATAMTTTLAIVPTPGFCLSGIQTSSTSTPVIATIAPKLSPVRFVEALVQHVPRVRGRASRGSAWPCSRRRATGRRRAAERRRAGATVTETWWSAVMEAMWPY